MEYSKLVAISGLTGLFEMVSSRSDGGVVKSLEDSTTRFVSNRQHNFSHLEGIEVYTVKENVNLSDIFLAMKESKEKAPGSQADTKEIKAYFEKVYPTLDQERVYISDMKKMLKWLEILTKNNIEIKLSEHPLEEGGMEPEKKMNNNNAGSAKPTSVRNAPPKKITGPRKMV